MLWVHGWGYAFEWTSTDFWGNTSVSAARVEYIGSSQTGQRIRLKDGLLMTITKEKKSSLIGEFAVKSGDTGSSDVQIAILTTRINNLTEHMKLNSKDYGTRRGLQAMVARRRRLLDYVRDHNPQHYLDLLARLGIRK